jgi:hypothetical protein
MMDPDPQFDPGAGPAMPDLEDLWADILSTDPVRVRRAFDRLSGADAQRIRAHLQRMAHEEGWHPGQRRAARAALTALEARPDRAGPEGS